ALGPPVLCTTMSMPPNASAATPTKRSIAAPSVRSTGRTTGSGPPASRMAAATSARAVSDRAPIATRAPCDARRIAMARPSPWLAAVTIARFPSSPVVSGIGADHTVLQRGEARDLTAHHVALFDRSRARRARGDHVTGL